MYKQNFTARGNQIRKALEYTYVFMIAYVESQ